MPKSMSLRKLQAEASALVDAAPPELFPPWAQRALSGKGGQTPQNESVRTASVGIEGKEILFPTIRLRDDGLERLSVPEAARESIQRKDFIEFRNPDEATAFAKALSNRLGRKGGK